MQASKLFRNFLTQGGLVVVNYLQRNRKTI
jgi:hypothetical protein